MTAVDATNRSVLVDATGTQRRTKESLQRIQIQLAETGTVGSLTLATLKDQGAHVNKVSREAERLNDTLKKTKKLQDRFAVWSLTGGTRRQARKLARIEKDEELHLQKIEKGDNMQSHSSGVNASPPRLHRNDGADTTVCEEHKTDNEEQNRRNDLFGDSIRNPLAGASGLGSESITDNSVPMSQEDAMLLKSIEAEDQEIEFELDILSQQLEGIMKIASTIGEETEQQKQQLESVSDDLEKAMDRQRVINHRARLFTMNRREKRNSNMLSKRVALASKLSSASGRSFF